MRGLGWREDLVGNDSGVQAPEVEFDHHSAEYAARSLELLDELRARCPITHTQSHDGYYVATGYEVVADMARDDEAFSSKHILGDPIFHGTAIPPSPVTFYPVELDPPEYTPFRRLLNPYFSPQAAKDMQIAIDRWVAVALDAIVERGEADLVVDFANVVPGLFTCSLLGIPLARWRSLAAAVHDRTYALTGSPEAQAAAVAYEVEMQAVLELVQHRRIEPGDDMLSVLAHAEIDGETLDDETVVGLARTLIVGGFGTTASLASNILCHLDAHHDDRDRLIAEPELLPDAVEEFLRYFTPNQGLARTVNVDEIEVAGCTLKRGDRVLLMWAAANHDPAEFDRPHEIVLDRFPNRHVSFGTGRHRCIGSNFARMETEAMVREVLQRIPDFRINHERSRRSTNVGTINGWIGLPATFTPGPRVTSEQLP